MLFKKRFGTGALIDAKDDRDFLYKEIATAPIVNWQEKTTFKSYPIFNQNGSSSCVAQAVAKVLGIENAKEENKFVSLSARDIYTRRTNNTEGMFYHEAMSIGKQYGATIEQLMPSQNLSEAELNKSNDRTFTSEYIGKIFQGGAFVSVEPNIDAIASIIERGKGIVLGFRWDYDEWDKEFPTVNPNSKQTYGHGVAGVDYGLIKGKKYIVIDDSWGNNRGKNGQRFISEDFITNRNSSAWYFEDLSNEDAVDIPVEKYIFNNDLYVGIQNEEVIKLQFVLQKLKFFPTNQNCTGYFGGITRQAVKDFQIEYGITPTEGYFGEKTREVLNKLDY
jgi:hypothetical protein